MKALAVVLALLIATPTLACPPQKTPLRHSHPVVKVVKSPVLAPAKPLNPCCPKSFTERHHVLLAVAVVGAGALIAQQLHQHHAEVVVNCGKDPCRRH